VDSEAVNRWFAGVEPELARGGQVISAHLDEVDREFDRRSDDVLYMLDALRTLERFVGRRSPSLTVKLAVPLDDSETLDTALPRLDRLQFAFEPPSVYVFAPAYLKVLPDREEYRCRIPTTPWGERYVVEYACGRPMHSREMGWEFSRTLWLRWVAADPQHVTPAPQ